jgi:predicted permease
MRQLLTESLLLALLGTALGSAAAPFAAHMLTAFLASSDPLQPTLNTAPDLRVFAFTAVVAAVATILTGLAPALRSTGRDLQTPIREGSGTLRGTERRRLWPNLLLASEVALALMLVTGASLLGFSLVKLHNIPVGFDAQGLLFLQLDMDKQSRDGEALVQLYHRIADGLVSLPGISSVSFVNMAPLYGSWWKGDVAVPGHPPHELFQNHVGPDYFRAMRTRLFNGREFSWADTDESKPVAIVNEAAAHILFSSANPIGQRIAVDDGKTLADVVGVVADAKYSVLRDPAPPAVYWPFTQGMKNKLSLQAVLRVRNGASPASVVASARRAIRQLDDEIPPPVATTMEQTISQVLSTERMMSSLALFFAALALFITGIGLYGTLAYTTARRTGEIGIRLAVGAQRGDVVGLVCRANMGVALAGCLGGLLASLATSRLIAGFLYNTSPKDPLILAASALVLICVAVAASLIPAIRASRIDPISAIRYE